MARRDAAREPESDPTRKKGTIKRILIEKGFGFIAANGVEYFFHRSAAPFDFEKLTEGDPVTFVPTTGAKGPRAESVAAV